AGPGCAAAPALLKGGAAAPLLTACSAEPAGLNTRPATPAWLTGCAARVAAAFPAIFALAGFGGLRLYASSFNRIKVGLRPSTIPITPSRIISLVKVASRMRARSLLATGRKKMLAKPTP